MNSVKSFKCSLKELSEIEKNTLHIQYLYKGSISALTHFAFLPVHSFLIEFLPSFLHDSSIKIKCNIFVINKAELWLLFKFTLQIIPVDVGFSPEKSFWSIFRRRDGKCNIPCSLATSLEMEDGWNPLCRNMLNAKCMKRDLLYS